MLGARQAISVLILKYYIFIHPEYFFILNFFFQDGICGNFDPKLFNLIKLKL
jgi:hypothetical protein